MFKCKNSTLRESDVRSRVHSRVRINVPLLYSLDANKQKSVIKILQAINSSDYFLRAPRLELQPRCLLAKLKTRHAPDNCDANRQLRGARGRGSPPLLPPILYNILFIWS